METVNQEIGTKRIIQLVDAELVRLKGVRTLLAGDNFSEFLKYMIRKEQSDKTVNTSAEPRNISKPKVFVMPYGTKDVRGSVGDVRRSAQVKSYWAKMTPAQRSAEMTRRIVKRHNTDALGQKIRKPRRNPTVNP